MRRNYYRVRWRFERIGKKCKNHKVKMKKVSRKLPLTITIQERHRHRYEVNPKYISKLEKGGLIFSGKSPDGRLMEIAELPRNGTKNSHPFFLGTQFHPEFLAR